MKFRNVPLPKSAELFPQGTLERVIIIIIFWCFILCERQFFYKNSLALRTNQSKSHNITIYVLH